MKLNDRFSVERDTWCWNLNEIVIGKDKDGNPKETIRTTYHATLSQALEAVLERRLGDYESLAEALAEINTFRAEIRSYEAAA